MAFVERTNKMPEYAANPWKSFSDLQEVRPEMTVVAVISDNAGILGALGTIDNLVSPDFILFKSGKAQYAFKRDSAKIHLLFAR